MSHGRIVCDYRPQKAEPEQTRLTVGGNLINYPEEVRTPTANTTTAKILMNSTISTPGAKFMCCDVKNFYLGMPMDRHEFMKLPLDILPEEIIQQYNLREIAHNGWVYVQIEKGMYGLPQMGILANQQLTKVLKPFGYYQCQHTPGLWKHKWRPITFCLVVDNFGVKYEGREHVEHLLNTIRTHYEVSEDWSGELYCGIMLKWN